MKTKGTRLLGLSLVGLLGSGALLADQRIQGTIPVSKLSMRQFPNLTKLTFAEAVEVAAREGKGKVLAAKLESEDGYLVYAVKLATSDSAVTELNIDAGNGKILSREQEEMPRKSHDEAEE